MEVVASIKRAARRLFNQALRKAFPRCIQIHPVKTNSHSWLARNLRYSFIIPPGPPMAAKIERLVEETNGLGAQQLWEGYGQEHASRTPVQVRTSPKMGSFFAYLVRKRKPALVVEFGTAFGVSGMYWLAGLAQNNSGRLLTFEPNEDWAKIAHKNLSAISSQFQLITGTFEDNIDTHLGYGEQIDLAFIDAIHTCEFVWPQFNLVVSRLAPQGIVLIDDINFSADMRACWRRIADDNRVKASAVLSHRVGIVELA